MDLLELAVALSLPFGSQGFSGDYSLDVTPTFSASAPTSMWGASATALPGVVLEDPLYGRLSDDEVLREELMHGQQQRALGPGFWAAYAGTAGQPFEPYDTITKQPREAGLRSMWMPDEASREVFPLFRLSREGDRTRAQFLPGYPAVVDQEVR